MNATLIEDKQKDSSELFFIYTAQSIKLLEWHLFIRQKHKIHVPIFKIFCIINEYILYIITCKLT